MSKSKRSRLSQGTVQNVTTAFEQFWLPKPLLLGSAQRLKRWGFCRNDRGTWPVRSAGPPFPAKTCRCVFTQLGGLWTCRHGPCSHRYAGLSVGHLVPKKLHHNAAQLCARQGLQFIPLVVEACGGGGARPPLPPPKTGRFARFSTWDVCE